MHRRVTLVVTALATVAVALLGTPVPAHADDVRDDQWYLKALQVSKAHKLSQGEGATIGVIDSGIDATHPDLKGNVKAGKDYGTSKKKGLQDARDHGTSTSSLIVGHGHGDDNVDGIMGVAPKAEVVSVGVDWEKLSPEIGDHISEGIIWLVDQDVDIISVSMGAAPPDNDALDYARDNGVPVVASIGNSTENDPILGQVKNTFGSWPAIGAGAIPVSGTNRDGKFWDGSVELGDASIQPQLGLSAPGEDLKTASPGGGYATHSGTSGSAPIVAGTLALIKSAYPDLSYNQWIDRLLDTVDDKGPKGFDDKFGAGIVNPYRALTEETTYEGKDGSQTSSPDDRLSLNEQGKGSGPDNNDKGPSHSDGALKPSESSSLLLPIGIVVGVIVLAAVVVVALVLFKRRSKAHTVPPRPPRA